MEKFILVVYSFDDKDYRKEVGKATSDINALSRAMLGIDRLINSKKFYSIIEKVN